MKPKGDKAPRPKFHVIFPVDEYTDATDYAAMKHQVWKHFTCFDNNALDAARFFFGTETPEVEYHDGPLTLSNWLRAHNDLENKTDAAGKAADSRQSRMIPEGSRNTMMHSTALALLTRYGDEEATRERYFREAERCEKPLDEGELETIWESARKYYLSTIATSPDYVAPGEYGQTIGSLQPMYYTELDEATVFAKYSTNKLIHTPGIGFLHYNGVHWEEGKVAAREAVYALTAEQIQEAGLTIADAAGKDEAKIEQSNKYLAFARSIRNTNKIENVLTEAETLLYRSEDKLDADPFLLCTPSGTYDLRFGLEHPRFNDPHDLITHVTKCGPGEEGKQLWDDALATFFQGDEELTRYVQLLVGSACFGKVYNEQLIIAYGSGRNGKSTFWNAISSVLGTYAGTLSSDLLTNECRRNEKPEMATLRGKRLVMTAELDTGKSFNMGRVKQIVSTDKIKAEEKYKAPFEFTPTHTLVLCTNNLPSVSAVDDGTWRRLLVIPFTATIEGKNDIRNYGDYLAEHAGEAIMTWLIEGAKAAYDLDFRFEPPACVTDIINDYKADNDSINAFIDACCTVGPDKKENVKRLLSSYQTYCVSNGFAPLNKNDFTAALNRRGFMKGPRGSAGVPFLGLSLNIDIPF